MINSTFVVSLIALLIISQQSFGAEHSKLSDCSELAYQKLKDDSEKLIFSRHTFTHQFIDCMSPTYGTEIVIHEAVHFEDLGVPAGINQVDLEKWFSNPNNIKFNQYLLSGQKNGELQLKKSPKPKTLIINFLQTNYPNILNDDSHMLQSFLEIYVNDTDALVSYSFSKGIITELNGYIHGLKIEQRIKGNNKQLEQRHGVYGFLFFMKAYLAQIKKDHRSVWKEIKTHQNIKHLINLLRDASTVLVASDHCNTMGEIEKRDLFSIVSDPKHLGEMEEILVTQPEILSKILCRLKYMMSVNCPA